MKTNIQLLENKNLEFIDLRQFLNSLFKYPLRIISPSEKIIRGNVKEKILCQNIIINDSVFTCNLRMIGSYLPEKLTIIGFNSLKNPKTLLMLIDGLAEEKFLYAPKKFASRVIKYRFIDLIEAFLFSDFFKKVWKGDLLSNRCFVIKENSLLKYYNRFHSKLLAQFIVDNLIIESKIISSLSQQNCIDLYFKLNFHSPTVSLSMV